MIEITAPPNQLLDDDVIRQTLAAGLEKQHTGQKVLVLIPDHTRSIPLPQLFRYLVEILHDCKQLDFMVALGTHPALSEESRARLVGLTLEERQTRYGHIGILNHDGAFADSVVVPELNLHRIPDHVSNEQAVFVEPVLGHDRFAFCGLDQAAHDLWGKLAGAPVWKLWGQDIGQVPDSDYTIGIDEIGKMIAKLKE